MTPKHFLALGPTAMRRFIGYCVDQGWITYAPAATSVTYDETFEDVREWARPLVERCIQRGWIKLAAPIVKRASGVKTGYEHPPICSGTYRSHKWHYLPGVGEHCIRCMALPTRKHNRKSQTAEA